MRLGLPTVDERLRSRAEGVVRWRYAVLSLWAVLCFVAYGSVMGTDWMYFVQGSRLLFSGRAGGGLHLYASHPYIQIGPLALAFARPFAFLSGPQGGKDLAAMVTMSLVLPTLYLLERSLLRSRRAASLSLRDGLGFLAGGMLAVLAWAAASSDYVHADDILVLVFLALGLFAVGERRPYLAGLAAGLAVAAKPTGLVVVLVLLGLAGWGLRIRAGAVAVAIGAAAWLPFALGAAHTLHAGIPYSAVMPTSPLHLLGLHSGAWVRPVQIVAVVAVGVGSWRRAGYLAVPLACFSARFLLDPGAYAYYTVSVVVAALVFDLAWRRSAVPLCTMLALLVLTATTEEASWFASATVGASMRAVGLVALIVLSLRGARPGRRGKGAPAAVSGASATARFEVRS